jgi:hypothetical protein
VRRGTRVQLIIPKAPRLPSFAAEARKKPRPASRLELALALTSGMAIGAVLVVLLVL